MMGRKPIGDRPMTDAEKQKRQRDKAKQQRELARDVVEFVRNLSDQITERDLERLYDLKSRIRKVHPEINIRALNFTG